MDFNYNFTPSPSQISDKRDDLFVFLLLCLVVKLLGAYSIVSFLAHAIIAFAYERGMIKLKKEKQKEEAAALKEKESNSAWKVVFMKNILNKIKFKKKQILCYSYFSTLV